VALHQNFWLAAAAAAPVIALANQVIVGGLQGWTWSPAKRDAKDHDPMEGIMVPFPMRENLSWVLGLGLLNLAAQTFALVVALFSLVFGRDLFPGSALAVAVVLPAGLVLIFLIAVLGRHDPELQRIRKHVTDIETQP
jgi:hypothetical protein